MSRKSTQPPGKPRNVNIILEWDLHQRIERMAKIHHRGLIKEIIASLEESVMCWEQKRIAPRKEMIGEWMTRQNKMTKEQAEDILNRQKTDGNKKHFGEIAVEAGFITQATLDDYLDNRGNPGGIR
jgi:hypothetical protein